ncbi:MAG: hypothetical protein HY047_04915 [Acidobacteria bacterium]|nr:hypothetical protein [Acidobacteriota bacterium]
MTLPATSPVRCKRSGSIAASAATAASAVVGYLSIEFLLRFLRKNSTLVFIIYRILIGILILFIFNFSLSISPDFL